jgi:hypothetical protein
MRGGGAIPANEMPFTYHDETKELNELTRKEASSSFVQLSDGVTHYELSNPEAEKPLCLCTIFNLLFHLRSYLCVSHKPAFVLRYDLFGAVFHRPDSL